MNILQRLHFYRQSWGRSRASLPERLELATRVGLIAAGALIAFVSLVQDARAQMVTFGVQSNGAGNDKLKITAIHGKVFDYKGIPLVPTFHPAYLIRNPKDKWLTWNDAQKVLDILEHGYRTEGVD